MTTDSDFNNTALFDVEYLRSRI